MVIFAGQLTIIGFIESLKHGLLTATVNVQSVVLPLESRAVYVTGVVPIGKHLPARCVETSVGVPQLSVTVGVAHCAIAHESVVFKTIFTGQLAIRGFVVSVAQGLVTVTVNEQMPVLLFASFAV
jgi:hypothetical protein